MASTAYLVPTPIRVVQMTVAGGVESSVTAASSYVTPTYVSVGYSAAAANGTVVGSASPLKPTATSAPFTGDGARLGGESMLGLLVLFVVGLGAVF